MRSVKWAGEENPEVRARKLGLGDIRAGLFGQAFGTAAFVLQRHQLATTAIVLGAIVLLLGTAVLMLGCVKNVTEKRLHWSWALLGLLSFPGAFVVVCLGNRREQMAGRRGFDVVMPRRVSTLWVVDPDDPEIHESVRRFRKSTHEATQSPQQDE